MKSEKILVSSDGPDCNVIKLKPPMVFSKENVDTFIKVFDRILKETAAEQEVFPEKQTNGTEIFKKPSNINHNSHNKPSSEDRIKSI